MVWRHARGWIRDLLPRIFSRGLAGPLLAVLRWLEPLARNREASGGSMNRRACRSFLQMRKFRPGFPLLAGHGGEGERSRGVLRDSVPPLLPGRGGEEEGRCVESIAFAADWSWRSGIHRVCCCCIFFGLSSLSWAGALRRKLDFFERHQQILVVRCCCSSICLPFLSAAVVIGREGSLRTGGDDQPWSS